MLPIPYNPQEEFNSDAKDAIHALLTKEPAASSAATDEGRWLSVVASLYSFRYRLLEWLEESNDLNALRAAMDGIGGTPVSEQLAQVSATLPHDWEALVESDEFLELDDPWPEETVNAADGFEEWCQRNFGEVLWTFVLPQPALRREMLKHYHPTVD